MTQWHFLGDVVIKGQTCVFSEFVEALNQRGMVLRALPG